MIIIEQRQFFTKNIFLNLLVNLTNFPQIHKRSEGFIVGGENAKQGAYPFMAALGVKNPKNPSETIYVCGGSLVSQKICFSQK